jgi:hypothetical protein
MNSMSRNLKKYSDSTIRKHHWVLSMYEEFCNVAEVAVEDQWPLQEKHVADFLTVLGERVNLANSSLSDVVVPSLKRINQDKAGKVI